MADSGADLWRWGSLAHYADADLYARNYARRRRDVEFYVSRCCEAKSVLEYGCGEGRITIPLVEAGAEVLAVDHAQSMLNRLLSRAESLSPDVRQRLHTARADMRGFRTNCRFDMVLAAFSTFLHLYTRQDVEAFLAGVRDHLAPEGRFLMDIAVPHLGDLRRQPDRKLGVRQVTLGPGRRAMYGERWDYDPLAQVLVVRMEYEPEQGEAFATPLAHRQFFPAELEALLHYNHFTIERCEGGFSGEPWDRFADSMVLTCKVRP